MSRSFTAVPRQDIEQVERNNKLTEENARLKAQIEQLTGGDDAVKNLLEENEKLKKQLADANAYVDQADVENEQQYSTMTHQIEELIQMVHDKKKEILTLTKELEDKTTVTERLNKNVDQHKTSIDRQHEIIEQMREELDREKDGRIEAENEKDRLYNELDDLKRREFTLQMELEDVQRALDKQKEILNTSSVTALVDKWERRVLLLENAVREREVMLHTQQQMIHELRRQQGFAHRGAGSSGESLDSSERSALEHRKKQAVLRYITSDDYEKRELVGSIAAALDLTRDEEDYVRNTLGRSRNQRKLIM
ncbi:unnamed protein product, partial [Mesorhabditis spiculigera]